MATKAQLEEALRLAKALGFQDDVEHWTKELKKLEERDAQAR